MGIADELRCALMLGQDCWGSLIIYRSGQAGKFTPQDAAVVGSLGPLMAEMIRFTLLRQAIAQPADLPEAPGAVVVDREGTIESMSEAARPLLDDLNEGYPGPVALYSLAADLWNGQKAMAFSVAPGRSGRWIRLHASWLEPEGRRKIVVVVEPARPAELAGVLARAYGLTGREREVTMWIARGLSSKEMASELGITPMTVNDHIKAVFSKVGVQSRQQLVATLFFDHCLPRRQHGATPGPYGWFLDG
ncbi:MAG: LuxR family transcriptional regulator [Chloroflexi bacterium]|nr:LuxR family transcriptional regulator [Chloroflexota bacterium]